MIPRSEVDENGVIHEYDDEVLGEAWEGGPVLLSWFDGDDAPAGINVVIHEFAHKLDMGNGAVDGYPQLPADMPAAAWAAAFQPAYDDFCRRVDDGEISATCERSVVVDVEAFDWNCSRSLVPQYTADQVRERVQPYIDRITELQSEVAALRAAAEERP